MLSSVCVVAEAAAGSAQSVGCECHSAEWFHALNMYVEFLLAGSMTTHTRDHLHQLGVRARVTLLQRCRLCAGFVYLAQCLSLSHSCDHNCQTCFLDQTLGNINHPPTATDTREQSSSQSCFLFVQNVIFNTRPRHNNTETTTTAHG